MKKAFIFGFIASLGTLGFAACDSPSTISTDLSEPVDHVAQDVSGSPASFGGASCGSCDPCIDSLPGAILQDSTLCTYSICDSAFGGATVMNKPEGTACYYTSGVYANLVGHCETDPGLFCSTCQPGRQINEVWPQDHNDCRNNVCYLNQGLGVQDYIDVQAGTSCFNYETQTPGTCDGLGSCI